MLVYLSVEDIVLIEKLELKLKDGFTALTGETGAGKSILIDAVSLILGKRSERRFIRKGKDKGTVIALFHLNKNHKAIEYALNNGFDVKDELILRRQILKNGRSFCYLNDQIITLNFMKEIANLLIEIHGQNEQIGLLDISSHRSILDRWADLKDNLSKVDKIYNDLKQSKIVLEEAKNKFSESELKKQSYKEDLQELKNLKLVPNEIEDLIAKRKLIMSSEKIGGILKNISFYLYGDENSKTIYEKLSSSRAELASIVDVNSKFTGLLKAIDQTIIEYKEIEIELENSMSSMELNDLDIDFIESRLFNLKKIATKHNTEIDNLLGIKDSLNKKLLDMENFEENINKIEEQNKINSKLFIDESNILSELRITASKKLTKSVNFELPFLKLDNAKFVVQINKLDEEKWNNRGIDNVFFEVETNKGSGFYSIDKIASGGELSRLMLALKVSLFSDNDSSEIKKTIIFDEVDAGVGGAVADAIGERLEKLGKNNQVLVVTHHPQVAARSNTHLKVIKFTKNNLTRTNVSDLSYDDKLEELARMLSGAKTTNAARKAAESLLMEISDNK